jgi:hypothetical protein
MGVTISYSAWMSIRMPMVVIRPHRVKAKYWGSCFLLSVLRSTHERNVDLDLQESLRLVFRLCCASGLALLPSD